MIGLRVVLAGVDEIKGVTISVSRNFHMLSEITTGKKVEKFDCSSLKRNRREHRQGYYSMDISQKKNRTGQITDRAIKM